MQSCYASVAAKKLFGNLEALHSLMADSHNRQDILTQSQTDRGFKQLFRTMRVSTTRWWSHQRALNNVFFAENSEVFPCILDALGEIQEKASSAKTASDASGIQIALSSFETILTAHVFKYLFDITDPASKYLQSEKIDLLQAVKLVQTTEEALIKLRDDFERIFNSASQYAEKHGLQQTSLSENRVRRRKRMPGEIASDESLTDSKHRYKVETFLSTIDVAVAAIQDRLKT